MTRRDDPRPACRPWAGAGHSTSGRRGQRRGRVTSPGRRGRPAHRPAHRDRSRAGATPAVTRVRSRAGAIRARLPAPRS